MRYFIRELPEDKASAIVNTGDEYDSIYAFSDEFIEWSSNYAVYYYSKNITSGIPNNFFEIPIKDATWELFRSSSGYEDSLIFKDDTAALLFKLTWL